MKVNESTIRPLTIDSAVLFVEKMIRSFNRGYDLNIPVKFTSGKGASFRSNRGQGIENGRLVFGKKCLSFTAAAMFNEYPTLVAAGYEGGYRGWYGLWLLATHEYAHVLQNMEPGGRTRGSVHNRAFADKLDEIRVLFPFDEMAPSYATRTKAEYITQECAVTARNDVSREIRNHVATWIPRGEINQWLDRSYTALS